MKKGSQALRASSAKVLTACLWSSISISSMSKQPRKTETARARRVGLRRSLTATS